MAKSEKISAPLSAVKTKGWQFLRSGLPNNLSEIDARERAELCGIAYEDLRKIFSGAVFDLKNEKVNSYTLMQLAIYKNMPKQRCVFTPLKDYAYKPKLWQKHVDDGYGIDAPGNIYMTIAYAYLRDSDAELLNSIWTQNKENFKKRSFLFSLYYYLIQKYCKLSSTK